MPENKEEELDGCDDVIANVDYLTDEEAPYVVLFATATSQEEADAKAEEYRVAFNVT